MKKKVKKIKKQKIIGTEQYINRRTGEVEEMLVINKVIEHDYGWHKVWLADIMSIMDLIGNKKIQVLNYLLEHMDSKNMVFFTIRKIAKDLKISTKTVSQTIQKLMEKDLLRKIQLGVYMINPDIVANVNSKKRVNLLIQYKNVKADKIKFPNLTNKIAIK